MYIHPRINYQYCVYLAPDFKTKRTMKYLLIEEKAWQELLSKGSRAIYKTRLLERHFNLTDNGEWLDNTDVCLRLNISKRTLQYYRDNGTIPYSVIGKKCYYKAKDIKALLDGSLTNRKQ